jgi:hypothetical protein
LTRPGRVRPHRSTNCGETQRATLPPPRCELCGEVIGVYEPLIYVHANGVHESSRAASPGLSAGASGSLYHAACYEPSSGGDGFADA